MRILFFFGFVSLLVKVFSVAAQAPVCISSTQFAADECTDACAGCALNGYQGNNYNFTSGGANFCGGSIVETNSVWHAFIANASAVNITVSQNNCAFGDGLQLVVLDGCGGSEIACNPGQAGSAGTPKVLNFNAVPGQTYYLMINGYNGDACDYQIAVSGAAVQPPPPAPIAAVSGPATVCPGSTVAYNVPEDGNALAYEWTVSPNGNINQTGQNQVVLYGLSANAIEVNFPQNTGTYQVKVKAFGACGSTTSLIAKVVQSAWIPPTTLPTLYLSPEDLPYEWPLDPSNIVFTPGTYQFLTYFESYLGCDSTVRQTIVAQQNPYGRVFWDVTGNNLYNAGIDTPAEGINVTTSNGQFEFTDADGIYQMGPMDAGNQITLPVLPQFATSVVPAVNTVSNNTDVYNFALKPQKGPASGVVYIDNDGNGMFNAGDTPISGIQIKTSTGAQTFTNTAGEYQFTSVAYTENITVFPTSAYEIVGAGSLEFVPDVNTGYNFILTPANAFGQVLWDVDMDQVISAGDEPAAGVKVVASTGAFAVTGSTGLFAFNGLIPGDTLRTEYPNITSLPAFHVVQAVAPSGGYQFLLLSGSSPLNLSVDLTLLTPFRPGFNNKCLVTIKNESSAYVSDAVAGLRFPSVLTVSSTSPVGILHGQDSVSWNVGDLPPFSQRVLNITFKTNAATSIGTVFVLHGHAFPKAGDANVANNTDILNSAVVGSYDPNDKQVEPVHITPAGLAVNQPFEYTIRFQNTGNYPAENVEIIDSLSNLLDWQSLRLLSSSHSCTWDLSTEGVLKIRFLDIMLPDSVHNEPESHGFAKFAVMPLPGLLVGNSVDNFCDIYFDFNLPVRTNTTQTQVVYFLPGTEIAIGNKAMSVRPNPASFSVKFSWPDLTTTNGNITLYDVNGSPALVENLPVGVNYAFINTGFLPDGLYMAVLEAGNIFYTRRVVIMKEGPIRRGGE